MPPFERNLAILVVDVHFAYAGRRLEKTPHFDLPNKSGLAISVSTSNISTHHENFIGTTGLNPTGIAKPGEIKGV